MSDRVVLAITGASGAIYGIRALELLAARGGVETHLVVTAGARRTITSETDRSVEEVRGLADVVHPVSNIGASIASGSFPTLGMLVAPCSIKTLSGIATSYADNLVTRAADVVLKERRRLVLLVRETPLHQGHLRLMSQATEAGAVIMPPVPAFYHHPRSLGEVIDQTVGRALDQLGLDTGVVRRWEGLPEALRPDRAEAPDPARPHGP
ncbi:MAG TPA: UbiX family flavin prenyltransferase [Acidimicrobiales bacterium]|nr:UbiX family flavin prenyltransferase [Acidimicrobiales bacterium]